MSKKQNDLLQYSLIESKRFHLNIYRGIMDNIDPDTLLRFIIEKEMDVAIIRFPTNLQGDISLLNELGIPFIIADTLVCYEVDLKTHQPGRLKNNDLDFIFFHEKHIELMDKLVENIFSVYKNHYSSNPILNIDLVSAYQEWVGNLKTDESNGKYSWLIKRSGKYIGFATCKVENNESEGILYGILPTEAGGGLYGDLIKFTQRFSKEKGCSSMRVSTQVNNYAVQKVWSREGFFMNQSFMTVHINSLFNASITDKQTFKITFNPEDFSTFPNRFYSHDTHRVFEEKETSSEHKKSEILKMEALNLIFYRYIYPSLPKDTKKLTGLTFKFMDAIELGKSYRCEVSFPYIDFEIRKYKVVAKLIDNNKVCFFAYFDFTE